MLFTIIKDAKTDSLICVGFIEAKTYTALSQQN